MRKVIRIYNRDDPEHFIKQVNLHYRKYTVENIEFVCVGDQEWANITVSGENS